MNGTFILIGLIVAIIIAILVRVVPKIIGILIANDIKKRSKNISSADIKKEEKKFYSKLAEIEAKIEDRKKRGLIEDSRLTATYNNLVRLRDVIEKQKDVTTDRI